MIAPSRRKKPGFFEMLSVLILAAFLIGMALGGKHEQNKLDLPTKPLQIHRKI